METAVLMENNPSQALWDPCALGSTAQAHICDFQERRFRSEQVKLIQKRATTRLTSAGGLAGPRAVLGE